MIRLAAGALCALATMTAAQAQGGAADEYDFSELEVNSGLAYFDLSKGRINKLTENADVTILPADPSDKPVRLRAREIEFFWAADNKLPEKVVMESNVVVDHTLGVIRAAHAEWMVATGLLVFTGNPTIKTEQVEMSYSELLQIDLNKEEMMVRNMQSRIQLRGGEDSTKLTAGDVSDWSALLAKLQEQGKAEAPSPGKRILELAEAPVRAFVLEYPSGEPLAEAQKTQMIGVLNKLLKNPALYEASAWAGLTLDSETQALAAKGPAALTETQVLQLNRALLHAAYPGLVSAPPVATPAAAAPAASGQ